MDPKFRPRVNQVYRPYLFARYRAWLEKELGPIRFRLAETPLFISAPLRKKLARDALAITEQLSAPDLLKKLKGAIPARYDTPGMDALPNCLQVDFALMYGP